MRRLNGWQRIGIVFSVCWLLWALYDEASTRDRLATTSFSLTYDSCQAAQHRINEQMSALGKRPLSALSNDELLALRDWLQAKETAGAGSARSKCFEEASTASMGMRELNWGVIAFKGLGSIILAWLASYGLLYLLRWIKAGFGMRP